MSAGCVIQQKLKLLLDWASGLWRYTRPKAMLRNGLYEERVVVDPIEAETFDGLGLWAVEIYKTQSHAEEWTL